MGGFEGEVPLKDAGKGQKAYIRVKIWPFTGGTSKLAIIDARDLRDADWLPGGGKSDPYCICQIPTKPNSKVQTQVINDTADPMWRFECNIHVVQNAIEDGGQNSQAMLLDARRSNQRAIADVHREELALAVPGQPMH